PFRTPSFPTRRSSDLISMRLFEIGILPPAGSDGSMVLLAAGRAGELPLLDAAAHSVGDLRSTFELLSGVSGVRLGLRVDAKRVADRKSTRLNSSHLGI